MLEMGHGYSPFGLHGCEILIFELNKFVDRRVVFDGHPERLRELPRLHAIGDNALPCFCDDEIT